ncbi:MAG TPA: hypothetical protein VIU38_09505 [Anaerolineales bacterium]
MVTKEDAIQAAAKRHRLGTTLLWLGVLVWLPYLALRIGGGKPSFIWYLPFHLAGVISGSRMRTQSRETLGIPPPKKTLLSRLGHGTIYVALLVWIPYFYLKLIARQPTDVAHYLPYHLAGLLVGGILLAINYLQTRSKG